MDEVSRISNAMALAEAQSVAHLLAREVGLPAGSTIASFLSNRVEEYLWRLGGNLGGYVYASLNREYRGRILQDLVVRSGASWLITERAAWPELRSLVDGTDLHFVVFVDGIPLDLSNPYR